MTVHIGTSGWEYRSWRDGAAAPCADYFTMDGGKIKSETLVFDPKPFMAAAEQRRQAGG